MFRQSARLRQSGYYLPDGTPSISYRDSLRKKENPNRAELYHQFNMQWQSGIHTKLCRQTATTVLSPPDRGDSVKRLSKQNTSARKETPSFTDHKVTPNKNKTPSSSLDWVTPNKKETPSFRAGWVTPNKKETHSFSDGSITPNKKETHSFSDGSVTPNKMETHSFSAGRVTPNKKETPSFSVDKVTPEIESSSNTLYKSVGGLFGWISNMLLWLIILLLVGDHMRLFSHGMHLVRRDPVNDTFYNDSAFQTQDLPFSNNSEQY